MRTLTAVTILMWSLWLMGCAGHPQRQIPKGMPYPTSIRPRPKTYPMEQVRCLGGGIGGCSPLNMVR